jgi:hypothetical protein
VALIWFVARFCYHNKKQGRRHITVFIYITYLMDLLFFYHVLKSNFEFERMLCRQLNSPFGYRGCVTILRIRSLKNWSFVQNVHEWLYVIISNTNQYIWREMTLREATSCQFAYLHKRITIELKVIFLTNLMEKTWTLCQHNLNRENRVKGICK